MTVVKDDRRAANIDSDVLLLIFERVCFLFFPIVNIGHQC